MSLFHLSSQNKDKKAPGPAYNPEEKKPVVKCSICNGEKVGGFVVLSTGIFEEDMLIKNDSDLREFKKKYGIEGEIEKIY